MDAATFTRRAPSLYLPLSMLVVLGFAYSLGIVYRRSPAVHARLMTCTALTLVEPIVSRILFFYLPRLPDPRDHQAVSYGLTDAILLVQLARERGQARARWPLPLMLAVFVTAQVLWFTAAGSSDWVRFATWFRELPPTR
jgi:hypothetical protein